MIYWNKQIINPDRFRVPTYNISPFSTNHLSTFKKILCLEDRDFNYSAMNNKFNNPEFLLSGKNAIFKALSHYNLNFNDEIYIVTTTGNKYVSSCVTNEIEKYCQWSRELNDKTKLIFVIHEFGTIYPNMEDLAALNLPIIEDLAMSFFSTNKSKTIGEFGDFSIYSLPKFFPIQFGGILNYNNNKFLEKKNINNLIKYDLRKITSYFLAQENEIKQKRKENYTYFTKLFNELGLNSRLTLTDEETPSVFMFISENIDLIKLKIFMQNNGIECSQFYGENSFFLPVHQNLTQFDIEYIVNLIRFFLHEKQIVQL